MAAKKEKAAQTLEEYIRESAEKKKKTIFQWLADVTDNIAQCKMALYVGKYVHPGSTISIYQSCSSAPGGYVVTEGDHCDFDIYLGNGNRIGVVNFLWFSIGLHETVLEDVLAHGGKTKAIFERMGLDYTRLKAAVQNMEARSHVVPDYTEQQLRQVYFPVGEDSYHLLTILPASSLMWKCADIVRNKGSENHSMNDDGNSANDGRDRKWRNLTMIEFGGAKKHNISALNSRRGKAYLIPSLPPVFFSQAVRKPKNDFFYDTLYSRDIEAELFHLHGLVESKRNTMKIREKRSQILKHIIDYVLIEVDKVRKMPEGWTEEASYHSLPSEQKIWLDNKYREKRKHMEWIAPVSKEFARWLIMTYEDLPGQNVRKLGGAEFIFLAKCMKDALQKEEREG